MGLFRQEAIDHSTRRLAGDVIIHSSLPRFVASVVLAGIVILALMFATFGSYARKETVHGWLTPNSGLIRLAAREGGVVEAVHVAEGDFVKAGQPVATIRLSNAIASGDSYDVLSQSLTAQIDAAEMLAKSEQAALGKDRQRLSSTRSALGRELEESRRRGDVLLAAVKVAQGGLDRATRLVAEGALSQREFENQQSALLQAQREMSDARGDMLRLEREIGEADAQLALLPVSTETALAQAATSRATLVARRAEAEVAATYVVAATVSGRIAALPVHVGDALAPGAAAAMLTPEGATLEAELLIPTQAAGFIEAGQSVRLMYKAFPHQKFGAGAGVIRSVSQTVLAASDSRIPGLKSDEPVFIARVSLKDPNVSGYGRAIPLQPGLLLDADVVLDRRSLVEWLLDPLFAAGGR